MSSRSRFALSLFALPVVVSLAACGAAAPAGESTDDGAPLKVAVVLGGLQNDGGFNQIVVDAAEPLVDAGRIELTVKESVVNPSDAEPLFRQYGAEDYDLVIGWGLGFSDSVFKVAEELPDTDFVATGAVDILDRATDNVETWTYAADQYGYLTAFVAAQSGLSPVAIVDGELAPFNEFQYKAFSAGLAEFNPEATELAPIYTGSWEDPQLANQAAADQIALGAKLIVTASEGYTSGVIAAAADGGVATIGASDGSSELASGVNIGRVAIDWAPTLAQIVGRLEADEFGGGTYVSEIANQGLVWTDLNFVTAAPGLPDDLEARIDELAEQLAAGEVALPSVG